MAASSFSLVVPLVMSVLVSGVPPHQVRAESPPRRPGLVDACNAWREHIGGLIEEHRVVGDMDEKELFRFVRQFLAARDACRPGSFEVGLRRYEEIAIERPRKPLK